MVTEAKERTAAEPVFTAGKHSGKTVFDVAGLGDDGLSYLRWARKAWKTGPMVPAIEQFFTDHPELAE